jgi:hypothetical protein
MTMAKTHGSKQDGTPITDVMVEALADEAEAGYDVAELRRRQDGRPAMGASPASVESVRLAPELKRDLLLRAAADGTSVSDVIRRALPDYVQVTCQRIVRRWMPLGRQPRMRGRDVVVPARTSLLAQTEQPVSARVRQRASGCFHCSAERDPVAEVSVACRACRRPGT